MHDPDEEPFARLFALSELPPGSAKMESVGDYDIAIFNVDGKLFAIDDVCPHFGTSLFEGRVEDEIVICPSHGWRFNLSDGKMNPGRRSVPVFDVRVEDGDIYVSREPRPDA
jgi:nitrite reductase/ring-hydroxylating ferredoxin subunit